MRWEGVAKPDWVGPGGNPDVSKIQARSPPLPSPRGAGLRRRGSALPRTLLAGRAGGMGQRLFKISGPEPAGAGWVSCSRRRHGSATLRARDALHPGPGAVRAVAAGSCGHSVAGGDPGTSDSRAGECPGGPGAPGVTLYCKFLQIQH